LRRGQHNNKVREDLSTEVLRRRKVSMRRGQQNKEELEEISAEEPGEGTTEVKEGGNLKMKEISETEVGRPKRHGQGHRHKPDLQHDAGVVAIDAGVVAIDAGVVGIAAGVVAEAAEPGVGVRASTSSAGAADETPQSERGVARGLSRSACRVHGSRSRLRFR